MKTARAAAVLVALLMPLSGCEKKAKIAPVPQAEAPILPPSQMVHIPELPGLPPPPLRDVAYEPPPPENPEPVRPRRTNHHKSTTAAKQTAPADTTAQGADKGTQPPGSQTQVATNGTADASPIGQLSSTGEDSTSQGRDGIERLISDTESGLNNIVKRTLSKEEQDTTAQIKTFLAKARQSLSENDLDGAQTLATKAKVLLAELTTKK